MGAIKIQTHYDNLKVAQNAPIEVIRAAYKTLSQKHHPDRNPNDADAVRIMCIINASYEILTDSVKRREHDEWIAKQKNPARNSQEITITRVNPIVSHILKYWILYGFVVFFAWVGINDKPHAPPLGPKPYEATPAPVELEYTRPATAPNGEVWPASADYIKGYQRIHAKGLSTVSVDNSQNNSDVFVKLVSLSGEKAYPVRQFYIPAFGKFTVKKVNKGNYDIRYRDLSNGGLSRSEAFNLEEKSTGTGTQFSNITMTLYKVQHGNMQTYGLSEAEF